MFAFTVGVAWCKLPAAFAAIAVLSTLNLRGAKESIKILMPIFLLFIVMHVVLIFGTMGVYADEVPLLAQEVGGNFTSGMGSLGMAGMAALLLRAYSMGAGTYTGIEAVSNGFQIMREPRVQTATRTMVYMAVSLAVTTVGITLCYLLVRAEPAAGKTMNAVLTERFAQAAKLGPAFVIVTLFSEAADNFKAYNVSGHRHLPEISQGLSVMSGKPVGLTFTPHLTPMIRGIHATLYARLTADLDLQALFEQAYQNEVFVDVLPAGQHPETRSVRGSNLCRIAVHRPQNGTTVVALSVIDNLVKGSAGQAIQNMNIMFGFPEACGLEQLPLLP